MARGLLILLLLCITSSIAHGKETIHADLLIVGGDESGCAAAVQAARLGVKRIVLVNDIEWLGGQFCTQGIGPMDEWTIVDGKRVSFPRSGAFLEIIERIRDHNRRTYGIATPGNAWCGTETIEPKAASRIFEEWMAPYTDEGSNQIEIFRGWRPKIVQVNDGKVTAVEFSKVGDADSSLRIEATLTVDSSDWGDVIRLSGAGYMAGPDLKSRFNEPSAPELLEEGGQQEMNPISWCPLLREAGSDSTIKRPMRYDLRSFEDAKTVKIWVDGDGHGGIYNSAGWCVYTHRRIIDRYHSGFAPGTEATILNWPAHDYALSTLPQHVVDALERSETGASKKNIVDMSFEQKQIVFEDAKQRALEFLYWLQTDAHERVGDFPQSFRYMKLAEDYGTDDRLPPKPYVREGLRLEAMYITRESDVRTEVERPLWAKTMVPDGVFGWQFNMDFHPTRRVFVDRDPSKPWQGKHHGTRNWNAFTDRSMFPIRGLVPVKLNGLLGCSKNIGVTSMVQSALRLHGQMMHVGTATGTLVAMSLRDKLEPRAIASSMKRIRDLQRVMVRGAGGHGTLIWPWHDVAPGDLHFEAANILTILGIWRPDPGSLYFSPHQPVSRRQLATSLVRLNRATTVRKEWPQLSPNARFSDIPADDPDREVVDAFSTWTAMNSKVSEFRPDEAATWGLLHEWLEAMQMPNFSSLLPKRNNVLTRAECVDYLDRIFRQCGEALPPDGDWLQPGGDHDQDGKGDFDDPLPFDRDNNSVPDHLQPPAFRS